LLKNEEKIKKQKRKTNKQIKVLDLSTLYFLFFWILT
jgi:hypothetical protein